MSSHPSNHKFPFPLHLFDAATVLLLALATVIINWKMIRDGFNGLGDLLWHITWIQHFSKQISEGIWYPRWLAGTNFGYGSPTFVFYPPLVYYIGSALKLIGLNIEQTMTALFSLGLFTSGLTFYIYGLSKWGRIASLSGALFYMTLPPMSVLINAGGLAFLFAMPLIPLGLYLTDRAIFQPKSRVSLALYWSIMALTHVPSLLMHTIAWIPYTLFFLLKRPWKAVLATLVSAGIGFGLVSFYLLPAIFEQHFVNIEFMKEAMGGIEKNLIGSPLQPLTLYSITHGYFIYFQHLLFSITLTVISLICFRKNAAITRSAWCWLGFVIAVLFFMSYLSWPIWKSSHILQMLQSPQRLGSLFYFAEAALCGLAVSGILKLHLPMRIIPSLLIIGLLLVNFKFGYQLSRGYPTLRNPGRGVIGPLEHLKTALYDPYSDKLIDVPEYRPLLKNSPSSPPVPILGQPRVSVVGGKAEVKLNHWGSYNRRFNVTTQETSIIRVRTYYYPAWHLYVNQQPYPINIADDGTMELKLQPGAYTIELRYQWTQFFTVGIVLSSLSIIALVLFRIKINKMVNCSQS